MSLSHDVSWPAFPIAKRVPAELEATSRISLQYDGVSLRMPRDAPDRTCSVDSYGGSSIDENVFPPTPSSLDPGWLFVGNNDAP